MAIPKPKVSIVMGTYNRANLIERSIKSIFEQSFKDFETIIVDDGSTDNTEKIIKKYPMVRYFKNKKNLGLPYSLNLGIKLSKGEYIARLDDDDYWCHPDKLKMQTDFLDNNPDYMVCGGGMIVIDGHNQEKFRYLKKEQDAEIRKRALLANPFSHTTTMFRKEAALRVGLYDDIRHEDWNFWLKLGRMGKFYNFPEYFTKYLMAGQNASYLNLKQKIRCRGTLKIISLNKKYYPYALMAYLFVAGEYIYSLIPQRIKVRLYPMLSRIKRSL